MSRARSTRTTGSGRPRASASVSYLTAIRCGGPFLADILRGGAEFGSTTLSRFYAIHMLLLAGAIVALIGAHLYLVTRLGITAPPWTAAESGDGIREERV
jgi:quinol-cytochrome oxidoreductase complex cytochrome b subunit